ncbi:predicted protein [Naegleria gruberi]|uniref:Predicted protein n=1 Tax=Naegleria gruberi TaxID=5762 RepID=D2V3M4_NAEGR|nr:uncharacterized protein NAEGRDRAFT_46423 [Naegleria gruberi]EFC48663.1 predicted protein [Naegleria gruberi]|eukprot:XP_002681407.1 predicted protein [Naegleria gruberi strain NEG-M]
MVIASTVATILMVSLISYQNPIAVDDTASTYKNVALSINVLSNDYDPKGNNISLVQVLVSPSYGSASISSNSLIVYKSNGTYAGNDTFSYQITNGYLTANATVVVSVVNRPPEAIPIAVTVSKNVQNTLINIFSYVGDNDEQISDPDSVDILSAVSYSNQTIVSGTEGGYGTIKIDSYNGYYYSPASGFNGVEQFVYTISDGYDTSSSTITVTVANDAPTAVDDSYKIPKYASLVLDVLANDYDVNGDDFNITSALGTGYGAVSVSEKSITYITAGSVSTKYTDSFEYTISDGVATSSAIVIISVYNQVPVVYSKTVTVAKSSTNNSISIDYYDADRRDLVTVSTISPSLSSISPIAYLQLTTSYNQLFFDCCEWLTVETNNYTILFTPTTDTVYTQTFTVVLSDGEGTGTGTITIQVVNTPPVAVDDSAQCNKNQQVYVNLVANDYDENSGDTAKIKLTSTGWNSTTLYGGSLTIFNSTHALYVAPSGFLGTDSATYVITDQSVDSSGNADSTSFSSGKLYVTVINNAPTPVDDSFTISKGVTSTLSVLDNDTDPNDGSGSIYIINSVTASSVKNIQASIVATSGARDTLSYVASNAEYTDYLTYDVKDQDGMKSTYKATVTLYVINDAPVAVDDAYSTLWNRSVDCSVKSNDSDKNGDLDDSTISITTSPSHAVTVDLSSGACTDADTLDTAYFNGATSSVVGGSVSVSSKKVTYTPSSTSLTFSGSSGYYTATGSFQFQCTDGMSTAASAVSNIGTGIRLTTSNKLVSGTKYITFKLYDGLHYSTSTLTFTVTFVNTAPACVASSVALNKKGTVDLSTLYSATDANSDPVTYSVVSSSVSSTYGSLSGTTFTASSTTSGSTTISYTATDSQATTTCSISVVISNQIPVADDITYQIVPVSTNYVHKFTYTATDGDSSDTLTYSQSSTTCSSSLVTALNITTAGLITFVRKSTAVSGTCTMTLLVVDNNSPTAGQDTAVVTFVISSSSPAANDDRFSINQGQTIRIYNWQILQNDYDEFGSNTTLTLTSISCPSSSYCHETPRQVTVNGLDAIELDSDTSTCQADSFQYTMKTSLGTTKTATVYVEFKNCYCSAKIDFLFLLDSSGSIGSTNFNKMRSLAKSITGRMSISSSAIMVAIAKFHSNGTLALALSSDGTTINNTLTNMAYEAGNTATIPGLRVAVDALRPANGGRADADKVIFRKYTGSALTTQLQNLCKYQYTDSTVLSGTTCSYCSTSKTAYCLPCSDAVPIAEKINTWQRNSTGIVPYDLDNPYNGNNNVQWKIVAMAVGDAMSNTYGARQIEGMNYDPSRAMTVSWTDLDSTMSEIVDQSCNQVSTSDAS